MVTRLMNEPFGKARLRALHDRPWCTRCGTTDRLSVDQVVTVSKTGSHEQRNLRVLCVACHGRHCAELRAARYQ